MWEAMKDRRRWGLLAAAILVVALVWAVFPSLLGETQRPAEQTGPVQITRIRCSACPLFRMVDEMMPQDGTSYDLQAFDSRVEQEESVTWAALGPDPVTVPVGFTIANDSDEDQAVINSLELVLDSLEDVPGDLTLGCVPPRGGQIEAIVFAVTVDPARVDVALEVPLEQGPEEATLLEPGGVQPYMGDIRLPTSGVYTLRVEANYDTSAAESLVASSAPLHVMVVPADAFFTAVPPSQMERMPCPPG